MAELIRSLNLRAIGAKDGGISGLVRLSASRDRESVGSIYGVFCKHGPEASVMFGYDHLLFYGTPKDLRKFFRRGSTADGIPRSPATQAYPSDKKAYQVTPLHLIKEAGLSTNRRDVLDAVILEAHAILPDLVDSLEPPKEGEEEPSARVFFQPFPKALADEESDPRRWLKHAVNQRKELSTDPHPRLEILSRDAMPSWARGYVNTAYPH